MRIEFVGAQGTGKSSVADRLKELGIPIIDGVVRNLVKTQNIHINEKGNATSQNAIFYNYKHILDEYADYISTRSLIDVVAYTQYLYIHSNEDPDLLNEVLDQIHYIREHKYANTDVVYIYFPIEFELKSDGTRSVDKNYQKEIDKLIKQLLGSLNIKYYTISGSVEERVKFVEDLIEELESKKRPKRKK